MVSGSLVNFCFVLVGVEPCGEQVACVREEQGKVSVGLREDAEPSVGLLSRWRCSGFTGAWWALAWRPMAQQSRWVSRAGKGVVVRYCCGGVWFWHHLKVWLSQVLQEVVKRRSRVLRRARAGKRGSLLGQNLMAW